MSPVYNCDLSSSSGSRNNKVASKKQQPKCTLTDSQLPFPNESQQPPFGQDDDANPTNRQSTHFRYRTIIIIKAGASLDTTGFCSGLSTAPPRHGSNN
jgi:hypothetical protein